MSSKLRRKRKLNYAAQNSHWQDGHSQICRNTAYKSLAQLRSALDIGGCAAYFKLHKHLNRRHDLDQARPEAGTSQAPRRTESASREGAGALVPVERLFRRPRPDSGQVRDVAPRQRRRRIEGRRCSAVRRVPADLLSGGGRVCPRWSGRAHSEAAWAQGGAQAQLRGDGVRRTTSRRRRCGSRPGTSRATGVRARHLGPPSQHRTRDRAQKKTVEPPIAAIPLAQALTAAYETLRDAVIDGTPCLEGAAALRYHGMLRGLPLLVQSTAAIDTASPHPAQRLATSPAGDEFVRLLANLVLRTHSELAHVY